MNDRNLIHELQKLHQYLLGAHHATENEEASSVLHTACHRLDEITNKAEKNQILDER